MKGSDMPRYCEQCIETKISPQSSVFICMEERCVNSANSLVRESVVAIRKMKDWIADFQGSHSGYYVCPHCECDMITSNLFRYCPFCGFKIEWSE
jgi:hypothetical protein